MPTTSLLSHFFLKLGGSDAPEALARDLVNVEVDDSLHIPDMFTFQVRDSNYEWTDSDLLTVGQEVEILALPSGAQHSQPMRVLIGEITAIEPDYPYGGIPTLSVRGYDRSHRLHRGKKARTFLQMTDSDIATKIAREYGLRPDVDATTEVHEYILQNNQSDFEFIMERARRLGYNFMVNERALVFKPPSSLPSETVELEYGIALRQFQPRMSTASQFKDVVVKGWDPINKREIVGRAEGNGGGGVSLPSQGAAAEAVGGLGEAAGGGLQGLAEQTLGFAQEASERAVTERDALAGAAAGAVPGELAEIAQQGLGLATEALEEHTPGVVSAILNGEAADIAQVGMELGAQVAEKAFGEAGTLTVTQHPVRTQAEADALAKAIFAELSGGNVQAEGVAVGNPHIVAGCKVKLSALGDKFSGVYFVSHTRHIYDAEDGYLTEFTISGRSPDTFVDLLFGGAGSNPGMSGNGGPAGVVVGIVTNNRDPLGQGRVKVCFPWLSAEDESNWARVSSPMAGADRGLFMLPEVNDEVLVMFEQGDVNHPYVIGALWNGSDSPPLSVDQAVNSSGQVIRRTLKTRSGHSITLDDSDESPGIHIVDKTGNNRIVIDSKEDKLLVQLDGDVVITAKGKIELEANNDITIEARGSLSLKASSSMHIEATGALKLKGATIDLN